MEVTASLIEPGSFGIVFVQRRRSFRDLRCLRFPSMLSFSLSLLFAVLIFPKRSKTLRPAITPFPRNDDGPRDRTSKSSHDSDGLSIPRSSERDTFFAWNDLRRRFPLREALLLCYPGNRCRIKCRSMKLCVSLTGNSFVNFGPETLFEATLCRQNIEKISRNFIVLSKYKNM